MCFALCIRKHYSENIISSGCQRSPWSLATSTNSSQESTSEESKVEMQEDWTRTHTILARNVEEPFSPELEPPARSWQPLDVSVTLLLWAS